MAKKRREGHSSSHGAISLGRDGSALKISLCMIVKDEEKNMARCLQSVRPYVDEMVVVDTGSSDRTLEIAEEMGARVLHFQWTDNFAAARNYSIQNATGDWVLWLDADEELEASTSRSLRSLAARLGSRLGCYRLPVVSLVDDDAHPNKAMSFQRRLIRRRPDVIRFVGIIHEQVQCLMGDASWSLESTDDFRIIHYGYLPEALREKEKHKRNFVLLHEALRRDPQNPQNHFNLGRQYMAFGDAETAILHHRRGLSLLAPTALVNDLTAAACTQIVEHYYRAEKYKEAVALVGPILSRTASADLHYRVGRCWLAMDRLEVAESHFRRALAARDVQQTRLVEGSATWRPLMGLMDCAFLSKSCEQAQQLCAQTQGFLSDSPSLALRAELLRLRCEPTERNQDPVGLGDRLLQVGDPVAAADAYALELEQRSSGELLRKRGGALHQQRRYAAAADDFTAALQLDPSDVESAFLCGRSLIKLGDTGRARDALTSCLQLKPDHRDARVALFHLEVEAEQDERAVLHGLRAVEGAGDGTALCVELASCYRRLGRLQEAYDLLWGWSNEHPGSKDIVLSLVELLRAQGEHEAALSSLWTAIEHNAGEGIFYMRLGEVMTDLGRYQDALNAYEIAAAKDSSLPVLQQAKKILDDLSAQLAESGERRSSVMAASAVLPFISHTLAR